MEHTKGEWKYRVVESKIQVVIPHQFSQCRKILTLGLIGSDDCDIPTCCKSEEHANAKLIAAAPELLEALIKINNLISIDSMNNDLYHEVKNVINKATK